MLTKRKNRANYYAVFFPTPKTQKWISLKTEDKKIAESRYNVLKKRFDEDRDLQRAAPFVGINHEPAKEFQIKVLPKYKLKLSELVEKHEALKPIPPGNMKWLKIFLAWMTEKHPAIIDAAEIDFDLAIRFMRQNYGKKSGKTFNNVKSALSAVWKVLISYGIINYWSMIPSKPKDSKPYRALTDDEINLILEASTGYWKDLVMVSLYTGLRLKDIATLEDREIFDGYLDCNTG